MFNADEQMLACCAWHLAQHLQCLAARAATMAADSFYKQRQLFFFALTPFKIHSCLHTVVTLIFRIQASSQSLFIQLQVLSGSYKPYQWSWSFKAIYYRT